MAQIDLFKNHLYLIDLSAKNTLKNSKKQKEGKYEQTMNAIPSPVAIK